MTAPRLPAAELLRLLELESKATPGPWAWEDRADPHDLTDVMLGAIVVSASVEVCNFGNAEQYYPTEGEEPSEADRDLLVASRNALRSLVSELIELRAATRRLADDVLLYTELHRQQRPEHNGNRMDAQIAAKKILGTYP